MIRCTLVDENEIPLFSNGIAVVYSEIYLVDKYQYWCYILADFTDKLFEIGLIMAIDLGNVTYVSPVVYIYNTHSRKLINYYISDTYHTMKKQLLEDMTCILNVVIKADIVTKV